MDLTGRQVPWFTGDMEITQTDTTATHVVVNVKTDRPLVTMPEADAEAFAAKLGTGYLVLPVDAWLGARDLAKAAPAAPKASKAAPAPKPAPAKVERFATVPNGFGGTTTVKAVDVPAPAPVDGFVAQERRMVEMVLARFTEAKLEQSDVTAEIRAFATEWAKRWNGDFAFMVDMNKAAKRGTLSVGQAKGTMNCFRADVLRTAKQVAVAAPGEPTVEEVPDSRYALETEQGEVVFYQATTYKGRRYIKRLVGAPGDFVKYPIANATERAGVWAKIQANPARAAKLFSRKHTVCARCAAPLSDPCSRATGFGPDCSQTLGVAYVTDKDEALRILKEEGVSLEGLLMEALAADGESI